MRACSAAAASRFSSVRLCVTPWTAAYQASPSMGFFQAGVLEWGAIAFSLMLSHVQLFVTPWTAACQVPLSMGLSRQEDWSVLPFPLPGHPPNPGFKPVSPALAGRFFTTEPDVRTGFMYLGTPILGTFVFTIVYLLELIP